MRITIAGSSGLIGSALVKRLHGDGHDVVRLVRGAAGAPDQMQWDPSTGSVPADAIDGADAVVNLAGAGIGDHRWTDAYKAELVGSRLRTTEALAGAIAAAGSRPPVFLSGSAIGWYGDRGDEALDESSAPGTGFLADLCVRWEQAAMAAAGGGTRVTLLRTGIVLSRSGGALKKQLPLFTVGLGGRFGSGRQWQSWISIDDHVAAMVHLLAADVEGAVNLTAPNPVTNATFADVLGSVLHRPTIVPIPAFGPRAVLGRELADALLFTGQRVLPTRLEASGFSFAHADLAGALRHVLDR